MSFPDDRMINRQRDHLIALKRRRGWLAKRVADTRGHSSNYDKGELAALNWAIAIIENAAMFDVLNEIEVIPRERRPDELA